MTLTKTILVYRITRQRHNMSYELQFQIIKVIRHNNTKQALKWFSC